MQRLLLQNEIKNVSDAVNKFVLVLQVAIVLFRTLEEFYDAPLSVTTLPLIIWRFGAIGIGSLLTGAPST